MADESLEILIQIREKLEGLDRTTKEFREAKKEAKAFGEVAKIAIGNFTAKVAHDAISRATGAMKGFIAAGFQYISNLEQQTIRLSKFVGGVDAARQRITELEKFAAQTPFSLNKLVASVIALENSTEGRLAGDSWLRAIGDTAAGTGQDLEALAMWVGRLYQGLNSGGPIGEATMRLLEMGVITADVKRELEQAASAGEGLQILERSFARFAGGMKEQSETIDGQMSTLRDNIGKLASTFLTGAEAGETLVEQLKALNDFMASPGTLDKAAEWGKVFTTFASGAMTAANGVKTIAEYIGAMTGAIWYNVNAWDALDAAFGNNTPPPALGTPRADAPGSGKDPAPSGGGKRNDVIAQYRQLNEAEKGLANLEGDLFTIRTQKLTSEIRLLNQKAEALKAIVLQTTLDANSKRSGGDEAGALTAEESAAALSVELEAVEMRLRSITTFGGQFSAQIVDWASDFQTFGEAAGSIFTDTLTPLTHGFGESLVSELKRGGDAMDAMSAIGLQMIENLIVGVVNYGIQWLATQALIKMGMAGTAAAGVTVATAAQTAAAATSLAIAAPTAVALGMLWATPATLATIATLGGAAAQAPITIGMAKGAVLAMSAVPGFAQGGYTGAGGRTQPAGIVHRDEFVFSQRAVRAIGLPALDAMHRTGRLPAALPAGAGGGNSPGAASSSSDTSAMDGVLARDKTVVLDTGRRRRSITDDPFERTRFVRLPQYYSDR